MTMSQTVGTGGVPVFLPAGGVSGSPYMTLMGRPVIPVEQCSKLGDAGDILLADMADYIGIDKGGLESDTSIHVQFMYDEQVFRFRYRFNGTPYTNAPVVSKANASFSVSPYVALAAR
jgi:HK97 family phage major capsid protein